MYRVGRGRNKPNAVAMLQQYFGSRLRITAQGHLFLDESPVTTGEIDREMGRTHANWLAITTPQNVVRFIKQAAVQWNPITFYLEQCVVEHPLVVSPQEFVPKVFGLNDAYSIRCFELFLSAAVARAFNPGIQFDYLLVLQGNSGLGKTSFFRKLFGRFCTISSGTLSCPNNVYGATGSWCFLLDELAEAKVSTSARIDKFNGFVTRTVDNIRILYESPNVAIPRQFVVAGTTTDVAFIGDPFSSRRFLVLESLFIQWGDYHPGQLWAWAVRQYKAGLLPPLHLTGSDLIKQQESNLLFADYDTTNIVIELEIQKLMQHELTAHEVMESLLSRETFKTSISKIHAAFKRLGYPRFKRGKTWVYQKTIEATV